jgi:GNAT superfamily N-acetyltransferase
MSCDWSRQVCSPNVYVEHIRRWPEAQQFEQVARIERSAFPEDAAKNLFKHSTYADGRYSPRLNHVDGQHWFLSSITHKDLSIHDAIVHGYARVLERNDGSFYLDDVAVDKSIQNRGVGSCMVNFAVSCFPPNTVWTHVDDGHAGREIFYRSVGFQRTDTTKESPYGSGVVRVWEHGLRRHAPNLE